MFRVGVILNFLYIMSILILKEKIVDHLVFVSILYGICAGILSFTLFFDVFSTIVSYIKVKRYKS